VGGIRSIASRGPRADSELNGLAGARTPSLPASANPANREGAKVETQGVRPSRVPASRATPDEPRPQKRVYSEPEAAGPVVATSSAMATTAA
jgi:hypothetical protein